MRDKALFWKRLLHSQEVGVFAALVLLVIFFWLQKPVFMSLNNWINIIRQVSLIGMLSIGMTFVITTGEIDLSVGSVFTLGSMVCGVLITKVSPWPIHLAVLAGLVVGVLVGLFNGFMSSYGRIPSIIVTLGSLNMARGVALMLTNGMIIVVTEHSVRDPELPRFQFLGMGRILDFFPVMAVIFVAVVIVGGFLYHRTLIGFMVKAVGGNEHASRASGINCNRVKMFSFVLLGFLSALAGIINLAFLGTVQGTMGQGLELDVIAATIIGGTSVKGGEGSIVGTVIGVFIMGVLRNGLVLIGTTPYVQMVLIGAVVVAAVTLDVWVKRR